MREKIIEMAREADLWMTSEERIQAVERFYNLAVQHEREECIDLVAFYGGPVDLEAAIRARGEKQ